jgi:hypothetical protein
LRFRLSRLSCKMRAAPSACFCFFDSILLWAENVGAYYRGGDCSLSVVNGVAVAELLPLYMWVGKGMGRQFK